MKQNRHPGFRPVFPLGQLGKDQGQGAFLVNLDERAGRQEGKQAVLVEEQRFQIGSTVSIPQFSKKGYSHEALTKFSPQQKRSGMGMQLKPPRQTIHSDQGMTGKALLKAEPLIHEEQKIPALEGRENGVFFVTIGMQGGFRKDWQPGLLKIGLMPLGEIEPKTQGNDSEDHGHGDETDNGEPHIGVGNHGFRTEGESQGHLPSGYSDFPVPDAKARS